MFNRVLVRGLRPRPAQSRPALAFIQPTACRSRRFASSVSQVPDEKASADSTSDAVSDKSAMTPPELVAELDRFVVGQAEAKKAMANALRYRWRRKQLPEEQQAECHPRNILLMGPTGCGKTEIARRLAGVVDAPFVIAEATKYTEVGFHGRDIESVMRDLMDAGIKLQQKKLEKEYKPLAMQVVESKLVEALLGETNESDKQTWLGHLRKGWLDDRTVVVEVQVATPQPAGGNPQEGWNARENFDPSQMRGPGAPRKMEKRKLLIKEARQKLLQFELDNRITQEELVEGALVSVQDSGIVFLDEIDKIVSPKGSYGPDASAEGVQRDLLPIIEGTSIPTKYGVIKSDHVLFVCAGSFAAVRPSDMLAELQGRLPIKMKLTPLTQADFLRILTQTEFGIIDQNKALLGTEGLEVDWTECGLKEVCRIATEMNTFINNIGARRLYSIVEKITEDLSYDATSYCGEKIKIDHAFVAEKMADVVIDKTARGLL